MRSFIELVLYLIFVMFLYKNRSYIGYHLKFYFYYTWVITLSALLLPIFALRPRNVVNLLIGAEIMKHVSKIIGLNFSLRGKENLEKDKSFVIVANHQSSLDIIGMFEIWHVIRKMSAIGKQELLLVGPFGIAAWLAGITFINRQGGEKGKQTINQAMNGLKEKKIKLWVFPEGTRRNTGEIHQFKKGAFHTAVQAQVPIVPVVFSSYKPFLNGKRKTFNKGEVIITALPEISTAGLSANDVDDLIEKTRNAMIEAYNETSKSD